MQGFFCLLKAKIFWLFILMPKRLFWVRGLSGSMDLDRRVQYPDAPLDSYLASNILILMFGYFFQFFILNDSVLVTMIEIQKEVRLSVKRMAVSQTDRRMVGRSVSQSVGRSVGWSEGRSVVRSVGR